MVPWLRICGEATNSALSANSLYFSLTRGCWTTSVSVVIAPISMPSAVVRIPFNSAIPLKSTTTFGFLMRSLSQSKLSMPPARTQPSRPCCSSNFCASAIELGCNNSNAGITSRITAIGSPFASPLNVCHQGMLHGPSRFERSQDGVGVDRCAAENFISERIRECVQDSGAAATHRRLTDATCPHWSFGIRNIHRRPLHVHRNIENRWRLVLIEARRKHGAIVGVIHPLLTDRVADPENCAAKPRAAQRARMNPRADVGVREEIHDVVFSCFDIDLHFGEAR